MADRKEPLAPAGRSGDEHIAQLPPLLRRADPKHSAMGTDAQEQARFCFRSAAAEEGFKLVQMGKAGFVQGMTRPGKKRGGG